jgi:hypothetical protein
MPRRDGEVFRLGTAIAGTPEKDNPARDIPFRGTLPDRM